MRQFQSTIRRFNSMPGKMKEYDEILNSQGERVDKKQGDVGRVHSENCYRQLYVITMPCFITCLIADFSGGALTSRLKFLTYDV